MVGQGAECRSTSVCRTWIWPVTTLVSLLRRDGVLANKQRPMMVRLCLLHTAGKSESIRSSQARWVAPRSWCLQGKWEVGGLRNLASSSINWRKPRPGESLGICVRGRARCGGTDGHFSWLAARRSLCPFPVGAKERPGVWW